MQEAALLIEMRAAGAQGYRRSRTSLAEHQHYSDIVVAVAVHLCVELVDKRAVVGVGGRYERNGAPYRLHTHTA